MKRFFLCAPLLLCSATLWHPVHTSVAEVAWNTEAETLEIALHLTPRDLETALTTHGGASVRLDKTENLDSLIEAWLGDRLSLRHDSKADADLTWIGKELAIRDVWIYFQFENVAALKDWEMHNTLLSEVAEDYVATVQLRLPEQQPRSLRFDRKTAKRGLLTD